MPQVTDLYRTFLLKTFRSGLAAIDDDLYFTWMLALPYTLSVDKVTAVGRYRPTVQPHFFTDVKVRKRHPHYHRCRPFTTALSVTELLPPLHLHWMIKETCEVVREPLKHVRAQQAKLGENAGPRRSCPTTTFQFSGSYYERSRFWTEVGTTGFLVAPCTSLRVSFNWRDQGWGNRSSKVRLILIDARGSYTVVVDHWGGERVAPHVETQVSVTFDSSHELVSRSTAGSY